MQSLLLCSYDPIFLRNLISLLRQEGYIVDVADYPARAVQMSFVKHYDAVFMDSDSIGLSAAEAAMVIGDTSSGTPVVIAGGSPPSCSAITIRKPLDLMEVKRVLGDIRELKKSQKGEAL